MTVRDYVRVDSTSLLETRIAMAYRTEIEKLEQRHAENPKQWFAALADAYRKQGEVDLAIEYVKGGLELRPDYASAHIVLGRCFLDKNLDDDAAAAFRQVLELDAENIIALRSLAEIAERQGDNSAAREWLTRLLEVDPMNDEALEFLGRLGPEGQREEVPVEEQEQETAFSEMAEELGAEPRPAEEFQAPADTPAIDVAPISLESAGPLGTVPEGTVDEPPEPIEPIQPEKPDETGLGGEEAPAAMEPLELEPQGSGADGIWADDTGEPLEIVTEENEAIQLVSSQADEEVSEEGFGAQPDAIEPLELEAPGDGASALLEGMSGLADLEQPVEESESISGEMEPIELETPDDAAGSLMPGAGEEGGEVAKAEQGDQGEGQREVDDVFDHRVSVPPTAEVSPVELEAMRAADEVVARPTPDEGMAVVDEVDLEAPIEATVEEAVPDFDEELVAPVDEVLPEIEDEVEAPVGETMDEVHETPIDELPPERAEALESAVEQTVPQSTVDDAAFEADDIFETPLGELLPETAAEAEISPDEVPPESVEVVEGLADDAMPEIVAEESIPDAEEPVESPVEAPPKTAEIDAVELEKLRQFDASVAVEGLEGLGEATEAEEAKEAEEVEAAQQVEEAEAVYEVEQAEEAVQGAEVADVFEDSPDASLPLIMPEEAGAESTSDAEPEPVVTETMAEVYARQGLLDQAREIYEVLAMQHPDDAHLEARVEELNAQAASALKETRQSRFAVAATGGESAVEYLQQLFQPVEGLELASTATQPEAPQELEQAPQLAEVAEPVAETEPELQPEPEPELELEPEPEPELGPEPEIELGPEPELEPEPAAELEPTPLEEAFSDEPQPAPGEPTVPAADEVSLASVFDGSAPDPNALDEAPDTEEGVSYDEFYGTGSTDAAPASGEKEVDDDSSDDEDDFKNWLKGLKK